MDADRVHRIMSGEDDSLSGSALRCACAAVEPFYAGAAAVRNMLYRTGIKKTFEAPLPVISVGNITTGGTGKTPMVIFLAQMLQQHGVKPAVLMRGYGGTEAQASDEYHLILHGLHDVPVIARADRVAAVAQIPHRHPECTAILLDDGFQHRRLRRELDLVLIDASNPLGYGRVLPRGMLRESATGLRRADAVLITHAEQVSDAELAEVERSIESLHGRPALAVFRHAWSAVVDHHDAPVKIAGAKVLAACGIGNPRAFVQQARAAAQVVGQSVLKDHHAFTAQDVQKLAEEARRLGAEAVLVTEKDWVKLKGVLKSPPAAAFWRPVLKLECLRGERALHERLTDTIRSVIAPI